MLIRNAEIWGWETADLRIDRDRITEIGRLERRPGEVVREANGGVLLPGLHDHHIHLAALAARKASVLCGPPGVVDPEGLRRVLDLPGSGWIRGVDFHESVLGNELPGAPELDQLISHRPLRLQHRTGRMWLLNTMALEELLSRASPPPGLERESGRFTGRLFDEDAWLQAVLAGTPPDLRAIGQELAAYGVTGLTDMSPRNDPAMAVHFAQQIEEAALVQSLVLAGSLALADAQPGRWQLGPLKLHLHEAAMPGFDDALDFVKAGRAQGRPIAVHCVTEVELVFTLALIEECGLMPGDRIEHVSVASPHLVKRMAALGLHACLQPHFIAERGDRYLADVEAHHLGDLYRLRGLRDEGICLAGGSDAPYGSADPWVAMAAAVSRRTASGTLIGPVEALTPEEALALYLADPIDLTNERRIVVGAPADLCLLDRPWALIRDRLDSADVLAVWNSGRLIHQRVDQPPIESLPGADPAT